jgi:GPI-anchor transamidase subunit U
MMALLPPILLILVTGSTSRLASPTPFTKGLRSVLSLLPEYLMYFLALTAASSVAVGGLGWMKNSWGAVFMLPDLTPNTGLWWYFFTEMFDHFRPFFLSVFSVRFLYDNTTMTLTSTFSSIW